MHEVFTYPGEWWIPQNPDQKVSGTLSFTPQNGLALDLIGTLSKSPYDSSEVEYLPLINGVIYKGSKAVTLWECHGSFSSSSNSQSGFYTSSSNYDVGKCFIGHHFTSENSIQIRRISATYENLEEWVNTQPFATSSPNDSELLISPSNPVNLSVACDDFRITVTDWASKHLSIHEVTIKHYANVIIDFYNPVDFRSAIQPLYHLRNFIALGIGRSILPRSMSGIPSNSDNKVEIIYRGRTDTFAMSRQISSHQMLFTLKSLGAESEKGLYAWFSSYSILKPVYELYFAVFDMPSMYLDVQFLLLIQALEAYHRRTYTGVYMTDNTIYDEKVSKVLYEVINGIPELEKSHTRSLRDRIKYGNEYSLRKRLKEILATLDQHFPLQLKCLIDDKNTLIDSLVNHRNNLTHYSSDDVSPSIEAYLKHVRILKVLVLMCFLTRMDLSLTLSPAIIERSQDYKLATGQNWL